MRDYLTRSEIGILIDWGDALLEAESVDDIRLVTSDYFAEWYGDVLEYAFAKRFFVNIQGTITLGVDVEQILSERHREYGDTIAALEQLGFIVSDER